MYKVTDKEAFVEIHICSGNDNTDIMTMINTHRYKYCDTYTEYTTQHKGRNKHTVHMLKVSISMTGGISNRIN